MKLIMTRLRASSLWGGGGGVGGSGVGAKRRESSLLKACSQDDSFPMKADHLGLFYAPKKSS